MHDRLVATCNLTIIPNLTRGARPYGIIENVVTHPTYRQRGLSTKVLRYALTIAWQQNCYKVMLLTGSKQEETLQFYERAGFERGIKTGLIAVPPESGEKREGIGG
jgi:GNAT superfamily N-acetyltransferase